jgi:hypothetical protein
MKRAAWSFLALLLLPVGSSCAGDSGLLLNIGGTAWYSEWDGEYDRESAPYLDSFNANPQMNFGYFIKAKCHRWVIGMEAQYLENKDTFNLIEYKTNRDSYVFDLGYVFLKNPYLEPFFNYRMIDIKSKIDPALYGGTRFRLDHGVTGFGAGIETGYVFGASNFSLEGQVSMSIVGDYDIEIKTKDAQNNYSYRYQSDDVKWLDWYAGVSYLVPDYHIKLAAGYKQSIENIEYERPDVNPSWNPEFESEIKGPVLCVSFEL